MISSMHIMRVTLFLFTLEFLSSKFVQGCPKLWGMSFFASLPRIPFIQKKPEDALFRVLPGLDTGAAAAAADDDDAAADAAMKQDLTTAV